MSRGTTVFYECVGSGNIDLAALIDAGDQKGAARVRPRPCNEEPLCDVVVAIVLEQNLNGGRGPSFLVCVVIEYVFLLLEPICGFAVKAPQQRIQERRLAYAILSIDKRDVPVGIGRDLDSALTVEAAKIGKADFLKNHSRRLPPSCDAQLSLAASFGVPF